MVLLPLPAKEWKEMIGLTRHSHAATIGPSCSRNLSGGHYGQDQTYRSDHGEPGQNCSFLQGGLWPTGSPPQSKRCSIPDRWLHQPGHPELEDGRKRRRCRTERVELQRYPPHRRLFLPSSSS